MEINIKALCKQIKSNGKKSLIWSKENGVNYITNRHWAIRYQELPQEVKATLLSIFAEFPEEGKCLNMTQEAGVLNPKAPNIEKLFKDYGKFELCGTITNVILDYDPIKCRVIKTKDVLIRVSEQYMEMLNYHDEIVKCSGILEPVLFCEDQLLILPFRAAEDNKEDETVKQLLEVG